MSENELLEFNQNVLNEINAEADIQKEIPEAVFFNKFVNVLNESSDPQDFDEYLPIISDQENFKVDGYYFEKNSKEKFTGILHLFVTDFEQDKNKLNETLNLSDVNKIFKKTERFLKIINKKSTIMDWEESSPQYKLGMMLYEYLEEIYCVKITLITNKKVSIRSDKFVNSKLKLTSNDIDIVYNKFDIENLFRFETSGRVEPINIIVKEFLENVEFTEDKYSNVKCIEIENDTSELRCFLAVFPGRLIAEIFKKYGNRLLEQNVRSYLSIRQKGVNRGILTTIEKNPRMFFAFNNGLTVTVSKIEVENNNIISMTDLQVVNGGQTSNTLLYALQKNNQPLSEIFVQAKIMIVPESDYEEYVPKIAECSNLQNTVRKSDFFSSHPFHRRMHNISRRLLPPPKQDSIESTSLISTKWFYEYRRGQWASPKAVMTPGEKKKWQLEYPKDQLLEKRELAKHYYCFAIEPWESSLGNERCFSKFSDLIEDLWKSNESGFNDYFFKETVAKKIIYDWLKKNIVKEDWYVSNMSPITQYTYAISLLNYKLSRKYIYKNNKALTEIQKTPRVINYLKVWNNQSVDSELKKHLLKFSEKVFNYINHSITYEKVGTNIAMSARNKKNFWGPLLNFTIDYNLEDKESESFAVSIEEYEELKTKSSKDKQKEELQEIEGYIYENHDEILKIFVENRVLENMGNKISKAFINVRKNNISDKDIKIIKDEINKLTEEGVSFPS